MEEIQILLMAAGIGFTFWRHNHRHLTQPTLQEGLDQSGQGQAGANQEHLLFSKALKTCRSRVAERVDKRNLSGIGCTFSLTQVVREIPAEIFEKALPKQRVDQFSDHCVLLCIESSRDLGQGVLPVQIRGKAFDPAVDHLAFDLERILVVAKIDAIERWNEKSISLEFR